MFVGASDRMVTHSDSVQYEPQRLKAVPLTNSIVALHAGDIGIIDEILSRLSREISDQLAKAPDVWIRGENVVNRYVEIAQQVRLRKAEDALLAPLGLTAATFLQQQQSMNVEVARELTNAMIAYDLPPISVIICGLDPGGMYFYTINGIEPQNNLSTGFSAIGIGAPHALAQLIQANYAWNTPVADALILVYAAKRRAEKAPGVGRNTDMFIVGPGLNSFKLLDETWMKRLEAEYQRLARAEERAAQGARSRITQYVTTLEGPDRLIADQVAPPMMPPTNTIT